MIEAAREGSDFGFMVFITYFYAKSVAWLQLARFVILVREGFEFQLMEAIKTRFQVSNRKVILQKYTRNLPFVAAY